MKRTSSRGGAMNSLQTAEMRPGDFHLRRDDRNMWGNVVQLGSVADRTTRHSAGFVETPVFDEPRMFQIEMRCKGGALGDGGSGGVPFVPILPNLGSYTLRVTVRRSLDRDKGMATEIYDLRPPTQGELNALPVLTVLALQLGVNVEFVGTGLVSVQVNATPVCCGARDAYSSSTITRVLQNGASQTLLAANPLRRQFFVSNNGSGPLYLALDDVATPPGGTDPHWSFILPVGDIYESPRDCYQGAVAGVWDADDPLAYALVTEGF